MFMTSYPCNVFHAVSNYGDDCDDGDRMTDANNVTRRA